MLFSVLLYSSYFMIIPCTVLCCVRGLSSSYSLVHFLATVVCHCFAMMCMSAKRTRTILLQAMPAVNLPTKFNNNHGSKFKNVRSQEKTVSSFTSSSTVSDILLIIDRTSTASTLDSVEERESSRVESSKGS